MAIKYLDAKRLQGTNAERLAMTTEAGYATQCFTDDDDTANTDNIGYRSSNHRMWGGLGIVSGGALDGESPVGFRFKLNVIGACTGDIVGQIRSGVTSGSPGSQGTNRLTSSNAIDLSTIQSSTTFQTFNFDGSYEFGTNSDEAILIYWSQAESNATLSPIVSIALRTASETANTADVISTTNDGAPGQTDFEFWTSANMNAKILTSITYPSLPNGTIFNETDTYKYFMWNGTDTWNQMVSS